MAVSDPHREAPRSAFFEAWARFVLRFRWPVLVATLALSAFFVRQAQQNLVIDTTAEGFLGSEHEATIALDALEDSFGSDSVMLVLVEGDVFSLPFLERLQKLHDELASIDVELDFPEDYAESGASALAGSGSAEGDLADFGEFGDDFGDDGEASTDAWGDEEGGSVIDEVISLVNVRQTRWRDDGLWVGGLLDDWPTEAQLPALRGRVLADRTLLGQVVGPGGGHTVLIVRAQRMNENDRNKVFDEVVRITDKHATGGFTTRVGGPAAMDASLHRIIMSDFQRLLGLGLLMIVIIVTVLFRHPIGVIGPVLVVIQAALWTLGLMAATGSAMTMISNILPLFLICVGMGDSVHIQSVYRDARKRGADNHAAIIEAVGATGVPVFYTTMTTAIGLLSFRFASLGAIRDMGTFGAFGVTAALFLSLTVLPVSLSLNRKSLLGLRDKGERGDRIDRLLAFCSALSRDRVIDGKLDTRRRRRGLLIGAALVVGSLASATTLSVFHDPMAWIPRGYDVKDAFVEIDDNIGGTASVAMLVEPGEGGLKDRELMLALDRLEQHTRAYRDPRTGDDIIGNSTGVLDVVRESHRAINGGGDNQYRVPDSQRGVVDMFTLFENSGPDQLKRLATIDMGRALMVMRVKWLDAGSYGPLVVHIQEGVQQLVATLADVTLTGAVFTQFQVMRHLLADLIRSFGLALCVITLVMLLLLRDLRLGLIAMVPNLMPIVCVMGFMGAAGIPIDGANLMLASIAIGIAVDDTIHFLHQFKAHYSAHGLVEPALEHAFRHSGRAIVTTSVILTGGFIVFVASEMANIQNFGLLISLAIQLALFCDLMLCPVLLRTFFRDRVATPSASTTAPAHA